MPEPEKPEGTEMIESALPAVTAFAGKQLANVTEPQAARLGQALSRVVGDLVYLKFAGLHERADSAREKASNQALYKRKMMEALAARDAANSEMLERFAARNLDEGLRQQANLEDVLYLTVDEVESAGTSDGPGAPETDQTPLDDDWLDAFLSVAKSKSSDDMKAYLAKMMAGEIRRPGSFGLQAIQCLALLDAKVGGRFQDLCNISLLAPYVDVAFVLTLDLGNAGHNSLGPFGAGFDDLSDLQQHGLIISDMNSARAFDYLWQYDLTADFAGTEIWLKKRNQDGKDPDLKQCVGVAFTRAGTELRSIISMKWNDDYISKVFEFLRAQNCSMFRVVSKVGEGPEARYTGVPLC